jgi:hypothetical protein
MNGGVPGQVGGTQGTNETEHHHHKKGAHHKKAASNDPEDQMQQVADANALEQARRNAIPDGAGKLPPQMVNQISQAAFNPTQHATAAV